MQSNIIGWNFFSHTTSFLVGTHWQIYTYIYVYMYNCVSCIHSEHIIERTLWHSFIFLLSVSLKLYNPSKIPVFIDTNTQYRKNNNMIHLLLILFRRFQIQYNQRNYQIDGLFMCVFFYLITVAIFYCWTLTLYEHYNSIWMFSHNNCHSWLLLMLIVQSDSTVRCGG